MFPLFLCAFLHVCPLCVLFGVELAKRHFLASPVGKDSVNDDSYLRKGAIKAKIPYYTTIAAAKAAAEGIAYVKAHQDQNEEVNSLQGLHAQISDKF